MVINGDEWICHSIINQGLTPPMQFDYFPRYNYKPLFSVGIFQLAMVDYRRARQE